MVPSPVLPVSTFLKVTHLCTCPPLCPLPNLAKCHSGRSTSSVTLQLFSVAAFLDNLTVSWACLFIPKCSPPAPWLFLYVCHPKAPKEEAKRNEGGQRWKEWGKDKEIAISRVSPQRGDLDLSSSPGTHIKKLGVEAHTYNPRAEDVEAGGLGCLLTSQWAPGSVREPVRK